MLENKKRMKEENISALPILNDRREEEYEYKTLDYRKKR